MWVEDGEIGEEVGGEDVKEQSTSERKKKKGKRLKAGEIWAVALSGEGRFLAGTSYDGRIGVWDLLSQGRKKVREYETKGSYGLCVDMVRSRRLCDSARSLTYSWSEY